jgi:cytochrome b561
LSATVGSYGLFGKVLHWFAFALLAVQLGIGWIMPHIGRDTPNEGWVAWHLLIGIALLFLFVARYLWRLTHPVTFPASLSIWQNRLAHATHLSLYALVVVNTLLGWSAAGFRGWPVSLLGIFPLPALAEKGTSWAHTAGDIHIALVYVLLGLVGIHAVAALYHHFILRDGILQRMFFTSAKK